MVKTAGDTIMSINSEFSRTESRFESTGIYAWQDYALCAETDPELFNPEQGGSVKNAKKICGQCTVGRICLQYALDNGLVDGVWGGMSFNERAALRNKTEEEIYLAYTRINTANKKLK